MRSVLLRLPLLLALLAPSASAVSIDWLTVDDPGNFPDSQPMTCCGDFVGSSGYGGVSSEYRISKFEVSNAQYAEFLNAVAATDTNQLYAFEMGLEFSGFRGGIQLSGTSGSLSYTVITGRESLPVNWVSFWDAVRFANWLHNGQPTGLQDDTTTEDGAYTITPAGIAANSITRNPGATVFIPTEDEWYKAAYYDPSAVFNYNDYPTGTDALISCTVPVSTTNAANCANAVGDLTDVGSYTGSASPSGTFDQGGNASEWSETLSGDQRIERGGGYGTSSGAPALAAFYRIDTFPQVQSDSRGFRVASLVPPVFPSVPLLDPLGIAMLCGLLGIAGLREIFPAAANEHSFH